MKTLTISNCPNKEIYEKSKFELLRQLIDNKIEGFKLEINEYTDVDTDKLLVIKGSTNNEEILSPLVLNLDSSLSSLILSSAEELEKYINIDTFSNNIQGRNKRIKRRRRQ